MKFLVDAHLPKSLSDFLQAKGHDSIHTIDLPDANRTNDQTILSIASLEKRIIITKDSDFLESFLLVGLPEKLVLIKTGNIRNADLIIIFDRNIEKICSLLEESSLIEINTSEIIVHT